MTLPVHKLALLNKLSPEYLLQILQLLAKNKVADPSYLGFLFIFRDGEQVEKGV